MAIQVGSTQTKWTMISSFTSWQGGAFCVDVGQTSESFQNTQDLGWVKFLYFALLDRILHSTYPELQN